MFSQFLLAFAYKDMKTWSLLKERERERETERQIDRQTEINPEFSG